MINTPEVYLSTDPDWATHIELVVHEPDQSPILPVEFKVWAEPLRFLVATCSTPNGLFPPFLDAGLRVIDPASIAQDNWPSDPDTFVSTRLVVVNNPFPGDWQISATSGVVPYAVTAMAFHPRIGPSSPPSPGPSGPSPLNAERAKQHPRHLHLQ